MTPSTCLRQLQQRTILREHRLRSCNFATVDHNISDHGHRHRPPRRRPQVPSWRTASSLRRPPRSPRPHSLAVHARSFPVHGGRNTTVVMYRSQSLTTPSPNPSPSAVNVKHDIATRYAAAIVPRELYATTPETALSRAESYVKTTPAPAAVYDMSMETMLSLQVRAGTRIGHRNPLPPSPPPPRSPPPRSPHTQAHNRVHTGAARSVGVMETVTKFLRGLPLHVRTCPLTPPPIRTCAGGGIRL